MAIETGTVAPAIPGVPLGNGPRVLWFYKVTCPVCRLAAPVAEALQRAYPGTVSGIGQDPHQQLTEFRESTRTSFDAVSDQHPYPVSLAYGIEVVPTLVLVGADGSVEDVVESWDRDGYNRMSLRLSELTERPYAEVSTPADGLPPFRPG